MSLAKYSLLAILIAGGGAAGLYLSGGWPGTKAASSANSESGTPKAAELASGSQRFPLTSLDIKDQVEAPELSADASGRVYLIWASQTSPSEKAVFLTRTDDAGAFTTPTAISRSGIVKFPAVMNGKSITRDSRLAPHVVSGQGVLHLAWTEALPDLAGVRMVHAISLDGGATLGQSECVHQSLAARPTFTALAIGPDGSIACSWLDNRNKIQQPFASVREAGQSSFEEEHLIHPGERGRGICPCCPTAAVFDADGTLYVAFRNIQDGYRDIVIGRKKRGQSNFEGPFPVVPPTWKFDGCPHDGASMAIVGDALHVVWMDARTGSQRCYYAQAKLADMKFESRELNPITVGTQGNAKLFADTSGAIHAVWEESLAAEPAGDHKHHGPPKVGSGGGRTIMYSCLTPGSGQFAPARAVTGKPGVFQTRPALVGTPRGELFVAWNELDETGKAVVVTRLGVAEERP